MEDNMQESRLMNRRTKWIAAGIAAAAIAIGGVGMTLANGNGDGNGDGDTPIAGTDLDRASQAALDHTGGGTVLEAEADDDGAAFSVEVKLDDGTVVDVKLDESFNVTSDSPSDGANDTGSHEGESGD
jgi:hypothetical protein